MKTILHEMRFSPFCIPIAQALRAAGIAFESREVPNWDRSELLRLTGGAYYSVPLLQHGERLVFESGSDTQDVAQYVDRTWLGGRLFPEAIEAAHECVIEFLENEVEARTFKLVDIHWIPAVPDVAHRGMAIRHKERKFGRGCVDAWRRDAAAIRAELDRLLARFETTLRHQQFLFGTAPVYADFLLFGVVGNLTFNDWNRLSPEQGAIAAWRERLAAWRAERP
ncbi:MAG: glutathione S-transferase family protein [Chthoniobacteraceae bacterium]